MLHQPLISGAYAPPFDSGPIVRMSFPEGATVGEMVAAMKVHGLPPWFEDMGEVRLDGDLVYRAHWHRVRPKARKDGWPVCITFHIALQGGGDSGGAGKQIVGLVAAIALAAVTAGIGGGFGAGLGGGWFAAGSISAKVLAGAVGIVGALAIAALTAPPALNAGETPASRRDEDRTASASGNAAAEPGGTIDRVIGTTKVFPKIAGEPLVSLEGDTQNDIVEVACILNGPHHLDEIRVGGVTTDDDADIEIQTREGWQDDPVIDLFTRYGRSTGTQAELRAHEIQPENADRLLNQSNPLKSLPTWHGARSRPSPDEIWIRLAMGGWRFNSNDNQLAVPVRIRIKRQGTSTWINLPEVHFSASKNVVFKQEIHIKFSAAGPETIPQVPTKDGMAAAFKSVTGQSTPPTDGWTADSYFSAGAGSNGLYRSVEGSTNVRHTFLYQNRVEFWLDPATFAPGIYDVQVMRGYAYSKSSFDYSAYTLSGSVRDLFFYEQTGGNAVIAQTREGITDAITFQRMTSVWNAPILPKPGLATIAIKARNKQLNQISVVASGYTKDWDGAGWSTKVYGGQYIAAHFRDVMCGRENADPLPEELVDDETLIAWRADCVAKGYECNEVFDGSTVEEVRNLIASCGYARPYQSEIWGVIRDYDRSSEPIVQMFTPRNSRGLSFRKAFAQLPDGLRIQFRDKDNDWEPDETIVYRDGYDGGEGGLLETATFGGLDTFAAIEARAAFDLKQARARSTFYSWESPVEAIACRRGSLVGINHDTLKHHSGSARIKSIEYDVNGDISSITLDSKVEVKNKPKMLAISSILGVTSMLDIGARTAFAVRRTTGVSTVHVTDAATDGETATLVPDAPLTRQTTDGSIYDIADGNSTIDQIEPGCLVAIGPRENVTTRVIVADMRFSKDLTANITAVDEAPELWPGLIDFALLQESGDFLLQESGDYLLTEDAT